MGSSILNVLIDSAFGCCTWVRKPRVLSNHSALFRYGEHLRAALLILAHFFCVLLLIFLLCAGANTSRTLVNSWSCRCECEEEGAEQVWKTRPDAVTVI